MKALLVSTFLAAPVALILFPSTLEVVVSLLFAIGLSAIVLVDYSGGMPPLATNAKLPSAVTPRRERFGLAA